MYNVSRETSKKGVYMKLKKLSKQLHPLTDLHIFYGKGDFYDSLYACCVFENKEIKNATIYKIDIINENRLNIYLKGVKKWY